MDATEHRTIIWGECHAALAVLDDVDRTIGEADRMQAAGRNVGMSEEAIKAARTFLLSARAEVLRALAAIGGNREIRRLPPWSGPTDPA